MKVLNYQKYYTGDEGELNSIGYFLQQSAELCIKHCMEVAGIRYEHTCVIEDFLDRCDDSCNYTEDFYNFAPAITKMESKTRYIKNYRLAARQVQKAFKLIRELLLTNGSTEYALELQSPTNEIILRGLNVTAIVLEPIAALSDKTS